MLCLTQCTLYLHLLFVVEFLVSQLLKGDATCMIMLQFFSKGHTIKVEDRRFILWHSMLALAIVQKGTAVWFRTMFRKVNIGFFFILQQEHGTLHL